jgi:hypothetical protein
MRKKITPINYIGILLIVTSVAFFIIMRNFSVEMLQLIDREHTTSCYSYEVCPHVAVLNQAYIGYGISALILGIGFFLLFYGNKLIRRGIETSENKRRWEENIKALTGDEKKIYEMLMAANGVMFQSEIVERLGFPKAKVSRILDRMEASNLVERKRRGMTNAIVLK